MFKNYMEEGLFFAPVPIINRSRPNYFQTGAKNNRSGAIYNWVGSKSDFAVIFPLNQNLYVSLRFIS